MIMTINVLLFSIERKVLDTKPNVRTFKNVRLEQVFSMVKTKKKLIFVANSIFNKLNRFFTCFYKNFFQLLENSKGYLRIRFLSTKYTV